MQFPLLHARAVIIVCAGVSRGPSSESWFQDLSVSCRQAMNNLHVNELHPPP